MGLNKAQIWAMSNYHERLELVWDETLSCYNGIVGSGCSACDAYALRAKGLREFLLDKSAARASILKRRGGMSKGEWR